MKKFKFKSKKHISLSLVALILIMLMTVSVTYSWIDDIKQIQITTSDDAEGTPLKTGVDINAKVNVTKKNNTINLGDMIEDGDIKYDNNGKSEIKFDSNDEGNGHYFKNGEIDKKKGYFYESGGMHLSGCYSDGEHFYFAKSNGNYREGNKDDENVNYISFTVQVSSPYADVDFWFKSVPKVYKHDTNTAISTARYAINANGQNHVYSSDVTPGATKTCNSTLDGLINVDGVRKTSAYTYNHDDNTTEDQGDNSNVLFSVKKGNTINVTFKIWNQGSFDSDIAATDIDLSLVSSWAYTRKVTIIDKTTGPNDGVSWINNHSAKLFVTLPEFLKDRNSDVDQWDDLTATNDYSIPFYEINSLVKNGSDDDGSYKYYEIQVPLVFNNSELILYRCNSNAWNNSASDAVARSSYNVHCWNWWRTYLPNTYKGATYTLYGSSMDQTAHTTFGTTITNKGYGTWGGVEKISVYSHYTVSGNYNKNGGSYSISTDWATSNNHNYKMFVKDYSDESSSGEVYIYTMYRQNDNDSTPWVVYMPKSSALIQFDYYNNGIKGTWGYRSWANEACPQQRPLKSDIYDSNSTVYHITANDGVPYGRGYWEGANCVYIIKSGWLSSASSVTAYMWWNNTSANKTTENSADPGETVTQLKKAGDSSTNIYYNTNSPVYKTTAPFPKGFKDIKFTYMNGDNQGDSSNNLVLFPGCFYLPDTNNHDQDGQWLGSLTDTGRSASGSSEASGDDDTGTGTISGYTVDSGFTVQLGGNTYTVYTNSDGNTFKVRLPLDSGDNWTTFQKNYLNYGLSSSGQYYAVPRDSGLNIYLTKGVSNNISLRASSEGSYIVTFTYDNGNINTIKIDSAIKE